MRSFHYLADLVDRQLIYVLQQEDLAVVHRKGWQCFFKTGVLGQFDAVPVVFADEKADVFTFDLETAEIIGYFVVCDSYEPGVNAALAGKFIRWFKGAEECFLGNVLGDAAVSPYAVIYKRVKRNAFLRNFCLSDRMRLSFVKANYSYDCLAYKSKIGD